MSLSSTFRHQRRTIKPQVLSLSLDKNEKIVI